MAEAIDIDGARAVPQRHYYTCRWDGESAWPVVQKVSARTTCSSCWVRRRTCHAAGGLELTMGNPVPDVAPKLGVEGILRVRGVLLPVPHKPSEVLLGPGAEYQMLLAGLLPEAQIVDILDPDLDSRQEVM